MASDRAAPAEETVEIISYCDYSAGVDCHFYITDGSGNDAVEEWGCDREDRPMVVTPVRTVTNCCAMHADRIYPGRLYGKYGIGTDRYNKAETFLRQQMTVSVNRPRGTSAWLQPLLRSQTVPAVTHNGRQHMI